MTQRIRYKTRDSGILLNIANTRVGVWKLRRFRGRRVRSIAINEALCRYRKSHPLASEDESGDALARCGPDATPKPDGIFGKDTKGIIPFRRLRWVFNLCEAAN
jgi:hypothetical protein